MMGNMTNSKAGLEGSRKIKLENAPMDAEVTSKKKSQNCKVQNRYKKTIWQALKEPQAEKTN